MVGAERTVRAFKALGLKTRDLAPAFGRIGEDIKRDAQSLTPVRSGRLIASLRSGKAKTRATVSAGGARIPYAGVINYGGYHNIEPVFFLNEALEANRENAAGEIHTEMERAIRSVGL